MTMQNKAARRSAGHTLTGPRTASGHNGRVRNAMSVDHPIAAQIAGSA
jgi:hypothetical protein